MNKSILTDYQSTVTDLAPFGNDDIARELPQLTTKQKVVQRARRRNFLRLRPVVHSRRNGTTIRSFTETSCQLCDQQSSRVEKRSWEEIISTVRDMANLTGL
jgi:hypothetical protein